MGAPSAPHDESPLPPSAALARKTADPKAILRLVLLGLLPGLIGG